MENCHRTNYLVLTQGRASENVSFLNPEKKKGLLFFGKFFAIICIHENVSSCIKIICYNESSYLDKIYMFAYTSAFLNYTLMDILDCVPASVMFTTFHG